MSQREPHLHKIIRFLKEFKTEVELRNSINLYDINIHAEYFYRDLFNLVYGLGLKNLNAQMKSAAYIDLIDEESKIAIQVTSQNDNHKITDTIKGFLDNPLNKDFRLLVLLIAKKAKEYRTDFTEGGKYKFNHKEDIIDIERLLAKIADKKPNEIKAIAEFLVNDEIKFSSIQKFLPADFPERVQYFTGRQKILEKIDEALETYGHASLAETHGVGKSSLIKEFAYHNQANYQHIIFLLANNNEFNLSISKILDSLKIELSIDAKPEQKLACFQQWLAENQNWLLLIDNVEDVAFIQSCKFNKPSGKVVYTANDTQIYKVGTKIELPKMEDKNAKLLLYKHWQENPKAKYSDIPEKYHQTLQEIAEKFGNHPFSMAFVGSYLSAEDESLDDFLEEYQKKEKNLLAKYSFITDYQHKEVAAAFLLRFEQISTPKDGSEGENFLATAVQDYLKLSAFLATDNIPEELLQQSLTTLHPEYSEWTNDKTFIRDIYKRFKPTSIFKRDAESKTLSTHRIVQEIMRFQIGDEKELFLNILSNVLAKNFELFDFFNKEKVERYLTQVGTFLSYLRLNKIEEEIIFSVENGATGLLCNHYARYFQEFGQYKEAEEYYKLCLFFYSLTTDFKQLDVARINNNLGLIYTTQGRYEEAELLYKSVIEISERKLGEENAETAMTYNNLAEVYRLTKRYNEAKKLHQKTLNIRKKILLEDSVELAQSYNNLGIVYSSLGQLHRVEYLYLKALEIRLKAKNEKHPVVATSYSNLGFFYVQTRRLKLAKD